jgi:prophage antirepressor-like protein
MTDLIKHPEFGEIETKMIKGEPWFVADAICDILGLNRHHDSVKHLDDDEKGLLSRPTLGGEQKSLFINESGLYSLILRSRRPEAKLFRKWVTSEVLPNIRKYGYYIHPSMMNKKDENRSKKQLNEMIDRYLTNEDRCKIAKKFGIYRGGIDSMLKGGWEDNAVMQECQRRALLNKEQELNAYHPERVREVLDALSMRKVR